MQLTENITGSLSLTCTTETIGFCQYDMKTWHFGAHNYTVLEQTDTQTPSLWNIVFGIQTQYKNIP